MTVQGMNKEDYIKWYMDAYCCSETKALYSWERNTEKKVSKPAEEIFEETRNEILY